MKASRFLLFLILCLCLNCISSCGNSKEVDVNQSSQAVPPSKPYENFTEATTYPDVIKVMGKPDAEHTHSNLTLPLRILMYGDRNLCLAFLNTKPQQGRENDELFVYIGTLRIHPSQIVHFVKAESGNTRPLLELVQTQVDSLWAKSEKRVKDEQESKQSEITDSSSASPHVPSLPEQTTDPKQLRELIVEINREVTYERVMKNPEKYYGEMWGIAGRVLQIQESGNTTVALISLDAFSSKVVHVFAGFTTEFVEGNQVYVLGQLDNKLYSYTSQANYQLSVPNLTAYAIIKPSEAAKIKAGIK